MKLKMFALGLVVSLLIGVLVSVHAQTDRPYIIRTTDPISQELRDELNLWLGTTPPSSAQYYIVSYVQAPYVSLIGVNLPSPDADWNFEQHTAEWVGTVIVGTDGSVRLMP